MGDLIALKLGGSVITKKGVPMTPNREAMESIATAISQSGAKRLFIVHGGGSFGHPIALRYRLNEGYRSPEQLIGFSEAHRAMASLNEMVVSSLLSRRIPAIGLQPSACTVMKGGKVAEIELRPVTKLLDLGMVPVLYGDVVPDSELGFSILSGDELISILSVHLRASRIILCVDVDGLHTADPKFNPGARLIREITPEEVRSGKVRFGKAPGIDVTGGMLRKIYELLPAVERGIPALIINGLRPQRVREALEGKIPLGTLVTAR